MKQISITATTLRSVCLAVAKQLGPGHSESVYQNATSLMLQEQHLTHHCEYHVPIPFYPHSLHATDPQMNSMKHTQSSFHVGSERIDILLYNHENEAHVIELKAVAATLSPKRNPVPPEQTMPAAHVQLLKYLRLLKRDPRTHDSLTAGYVVNFRQSVTFGEPEDMLVEFDVFDCSSNDWSLGHGMSVKEEPLIDKPLITIPLEMKDMEEPCLVVPGLTVQLPTTI